MNQNRFKSPIVWTAIIAQVLAILVALGVINTGLSETLNTALVAVVQVFVAIGVLNNPVNPEGF